MATPSNKPRDIKDLKARLGRTMTPGQVGGSMPSGAVPGPGGSVQPPRAGGSLPPPAVRGPVVTNPLAGPQASVPAPPFAQPGRPQGQPSRAPGAVMPGQAPGGPRPAASNPLDIMAAAQQAVVEKKVKLVIDDSAVKSSEVGRKSANLLLVAIGLGLGVAVGFGVGSTGADRKQYNMAVRDGKDIYKRINDVSKVLDTAEGHVKAAVGASQGGPGKQAKVDYQSIEALRAMERPFSANEFSRRRYLAFPTPVVDDLFEYYNNVNLLWDKFEVLSNKIAGERAREALDKSAKAAEELIATDYGLVVAKSGDSMIGGLVVVRPKPPEAGKEPKEGEPQTILVSSREGGREVERALYTGQKDFGEKYDNYVLMIDKGRSMPILGASANLFGQLRGELTSTQALMDRTKEVQGRLIKELGKVAALEETGFF